MGIVNPNEWKYFWVGYIIAFPTLLICYYFLVEGYLMLLWLLLMMGGLVPWWSRYKRVFAVQWGLFFGLSSGFAVKVLVL